MKYILAILLFALLFINLNAQPLVKIGMTTDEVRKIYPNLRETIYENTITLERPENLYGLEGIWGYRFEENKLNWIYFHKYINEINDTNFNRCLHAANEIIKNYTSFYGNPDTTITGTTIYIDPYKDKHWGYDVTEARWKDYNGMKIKVEFNFMGGKGQYSFLVSINYFGKDYPYYD